MFYLKLIYYPSLLAFLKKICTKPSSQSSTYENRNPTIIIFFSSVEKYLLKILFPQDLEMKINI